MQDLIEQIKLRSLDRSRRTSMRNPTEPPHYPAVQASTVVGAESKLGFALPPLLRELYIQVGNGGFGPGYGLFGLSGGYPVAEPYSMNPDEDLDIVEAYLSFQDSGYEEFVPKQIIICDWGCLNASAIDCSTPEGEMVFCHDDLTQTHQGITFRQWMEDWVNGTRRRP